MEKSRPFTLRLSGSVEKWLERESRRSRLSKGALLESLAEESIRTRRFPGIGFRGAESDRRAWLIGTGFEVWEVVQVHEEMGREALLDGGRLSQGQLDLALAYYAEYPEEIGEAVSENRESPQSWAERYPGLGISVSEY